MPENGKIANLALQRGSGDRYESLPTDLELLKAQKNGGNGVCKLGGKGVPTPMVEQAKLKIDLVGKTVDHIDYRSMIGSLMYVTLSRPDIMFATCLWYPKESGFDLTAYSDVDHAGCHLDRKTESKYVAVSGCCAQVLWMRTQLTDYGFFYDKVPIYCDSKSAITISCNPVQHTRTKHINVSMKPVLYRKEGVRFSASIFKKKRSLL
nr:hypothetical protein [Tanacetum cinerariifolium]